MKFLYIFLFLILSISCDDPIIENQEEEVSLNDTRGSDLDGNADSLSDYFFTTEDNVSIKYHRYDKASFYPPHYGFDEEDDTLNFSSFSEYYLVVNDTAINNPSLTDRTLGEPYIDLNQDGTYNEESEPFVDWDDDGQWDTIGISEVSDSLTIDWSLDLLGLSPHVDALIWNEAGEIDHDLQYYNTKTTNEFGDSTFEYIDTISFIYYHAKFQNSIPSDINTVFLDTLEWQEDTLKFSNSKLEFSIDKEFVNYRSFSNDSLMYRENIDCNNNGSVDSAEEVFAEINNASQCAHDWDDELEKCYIDQGNGIWDAAEPWVEETNGTPGSWDAFEAFKDYNCNGDFDNAEPRVGSESECESGTYIVDANGGFCDLGNNQWDSSESFVDLDGNGSASSDEIFNWINIPKTILVTYRDFSSEDDLVCDAENPTPLTIVRPAIMPLCLDPNCNSEDTCEGADENGCNSTWVSSENGGWPSDQDSLRYHFNYNTLIDKWCNVYDPIINVETVVGEISKQVDNIDSVLTIYSNKAIYSFDEEVSSSEFFVTKTRWPLSGGQMDYDYILFEDNSDDINKLSYPTYFMMPGYSFNADSIDNSSMFEGITDETTYQVFWHELAPRLETLFYASSDGKIRDGELVETLDTVVTSRGKYIIEKKYEVMSDTLTIALPTTSIGCSDASYVSESECVESGFEWGEIENGTFFGGDSTYKVTRTLKMTLVGPDLEYGEKNISWLVRHKGIVRDELYFRWSEPQWLGIGEDFIYDYVPGAWEDGYYWGVISRLEMADFRKNNSSGGGFLSRLFNQQKLELNSFENMDQFSNEPYKVSRTSGIQRVEIKK